MSPVAGKNEPSGEGLFTPNKMLLFIRPISSEKDKRRAWEPGSKGLVAGIFGLFTVSTGCECWLTGRADATGSNGYVSNLEATPYVLIRMGSPKAQGCTLEDTLTHCGQKAWVFTPQYCLGPLILPSFPLENFR